MKFLPSSIILIISSLLINSNVATCQPLNSINVQRKENDGSANPLHQHQQSHQWTFTLDDQQTDEIQSSLNSSDVVTQRHVMGNVFLIRHGEKQRREKPGLSERGLQRADCLRGVFGVGKRREVDFIMAQDFKPDGRRKRPYETVLPLAKDMNKKIHRKCDRDDPKCAAEVVNYHASKSQNVLLAWEHNRLSQVAAHLGIKKLKYPSKRYDIIFRLRANKNGKWKVRSITSEECKRLDRKFVGWHAKKSSSKFVDWRSWETEKEAEEPPKDEDDDLVDFSDLEEAELDSEDAFDLLEEDDEEDHDDD